MFIRTFVGAWALTLALVLSPVVLAGAPVAQGQMVSPLHHQVGNSSLPTPGERLIAADKLPDRLRQALANSDTALDWLESTRRAVLHLRAWPDVRQREQAARRVIDVTKQQDAPLWFHFRWDSIFQPPLDLEQVAPDIVGPVLPAEVDYKARRQLATAWTAELLCRSGILTREACQALLPKRDLFERAFELKAMPEIPFARALLATDATNRDKYLRKAICLAKPGSALDKRLGAAFGAAHVNTLRAAATGKKQPCELAIPPECFDGFELPDWLEIPDDNGQGQAWRR